MQSKEIQVIAHADNLAAQIEDLNRRTVQVLDEAEEAKDLRTILAAVREMRGNLSPSICMTFQRRY